MLSFVTKASQPRRTLLFGSAMHVWNDLFFALYVPLLPFIARDLELSYKQVGLLRLTFNGASAVLQVPAGFLAESVGEFWLLILGNVWVAAGLVGMGLSSVFVALLAVSLAGGLGGGAQHPLASSMVSRAYDDKGRSTAVGTVNFAGDLGKLLAPAVAGTIAVHYGWRPALWVIGVGGIVFMALASLTRRGVDIGKPGRQTSTTSDGAGDGTRMGGFVTLSGVGFLDSATRGGALVFLPFVMEAKGMGLGNVSFMLVLLFAGGAAGKFICGWLGDRLGPVNVIWGTKALAASLLLLSLVAPAETMAPLVFTLGIGLNGTSSVLYATVADFVPPKRRARLYGFFYTTNEAGGVLAPLFYGLMADLFSLNISVVFMGLATAAILPASLTLRRHLAPTVSASRGRRD